MLVLVLVLILALCFTMCSHFVNICSDLFTLFRLDVLFPGVPGPLRGSRGPSGFPGPPVLTTSTSTSTSTGTSSSTGTGTSPSTSPGTRTRLTRFHTFSTRVSHVLFFSHRVHTCSCVLRAFSLFSHFIELFHVLTY